MLAAVAGSGDEAVAGGLTAGELLPVDLFREALEALDPEAVILLDDAAADLLRETYADALAIIEDFDTAMLKPGLIAPVLGRSLGSLRRFLAAVCSRSMVLRPRCPSRRKSSVCGHISSRCYRWGRRTKRVPGLVQFADSIGVLSAVLSVVAPSAILP